MAKEQSQSNIRERIEIKEPHKWAVILWNDDFTTMEFVVSMLREVFLKDEAQAEQLMLKVHEQGHAVAGTYSYDVAVTRTKWALGLAREAGFPLRITYQEA